MIPDLSDFAPPRSHRNGWLSSAQQALSALEKIQKVPASLDKIGTAAEKLSKANVDKATSQTEKTMRYAQFGIIGAGVLASVLVLAKVLKR